LHKVLANRLSVVHGVECGDFVDSHRWHLQEPRDLIHDTDAGETMLTLCKIQYRHDCSLLILWGVSLEDLIDQNEVLLVKLERDGRIVLRLVPVLMARNSHCQLQK
jgi:hypothetical protein